MRKANEALSSLEGVDKVDVDFKGQSATVTMKKDMTLSKDAAEKAITEKGFKVKGFGEVK